MSRLPIHPEAEIEQYDATVFYDRIDLELGDDFDRAVRFAMDQLAEHPQRFAIVDEASGCRGALLRRFPYRVIIHQNFDGWYVVAIAHSSRMPGYWKDRLDDPLP